MNDNFVTYGTANVMVSNITYDTALDIQSRLEDIEGVTTVEFDDTDEHYTNASALFSVSFDAEVGDERAENALQEIRDELEAATTPRSIPRSATIPPRICNRKWSSSSSLRPSSSSSC